MSEHILYADCATPDRQLNTLKSSLREYVCPETGTHEEKPILWHTRLFSSFTFSLSPSKSSAQHTKTSLLIETNRVLLTYREMMLEFP
jgi:hypothetical protein